MRPRVLVVDDDPQIQYFLQASMTARYEFHQAATLGEGIAALDSFAPDLVLLDFFLPDGCGTDFLSVNNHSPVILLTARQNLAHEAGAAFSRVADYISKPFNVEELVLRIDRVVQSRLTRRKIAELAGKIGSGRAIDRLGKELMVAGLPRAGRRYSSEYSAIIDFDAPEGWNASGLLEEAWCVGGDILEDIRFSDGNLGYIVADVCGKGLAVGAMSNMLRGLFVGMASVSDGPATLLAAVNQRWRKMTRRSGWRSTPGALASALAVSVSQSGETVSWASAGHPFPRARIGGSWRTLESDSPLIGLLAKPDFAVQTLSFRTGDCFCAFSDGAFEVSSSEGGWLEESGLHTIFEMVFDEEPVDVALSKVRAIIRGLHEGVPACDDLALLVLAKNNFVAMEAVA